MMPHEPLGLVGILGFHRCQKGMMFLLKSHLVWGWGHCCLGKVGGSIVGKTVHILFKVRTR